ncbi:MAG: hypothetical protein UW30_C0001G0042 [Candidatus Giovannonibacteria bacterium GW2011_GWA2_44_13b]|uniref:PEGA domain-containing protein n=2 Tax=Candidatus Giovannoniibacteriota TaxID=1752738 RepID=A0A0G1JE69_9BACT|nr:MAG: hypothetical protein UW30_C0001G0042 [Candidatus Giovannonibacteria bacterium GW2011_GWA2_44_13b]OGF83227.1 MAG: hypothetical protein A2924_02840 [Candidatus Giovannonibacteria bacterium RIFCSPLOWO2_01_FULL_44_16]
MLTLRKRRILFWVSIVAFFLLAGPVLVYSLGYRLGAGFNFEKTGGIFIKSSRAGAEIYVDGKPKKTTSYLSESALVKNVTPGIHEVKVNLEGFWEWEKKIGVISEEVVSKEVLLVTKDAEGKILGEKPEALEPFLKKGVLYVYENKTAKAVYSGVKIFWHLSDGKFVILGEDGNFYLNKEKITNEFTGETLDALKNYPNSAFLDGDRRLVLWDGRNIDSIWLGDENKMPLWQKEASITVYTSPRGATLRQVFEYPDWPDYLLITMQNGVFAIEMESAGGQNVMPVYKGKKPEIISIRDGNVYILDDGNYLEIILP